MPMRSWGHLRNSHCKRCASAVAASTIASLATMHREEVILCQGNDEPTATTERLDLSLLSPISPIRLFRPNPNLEIAFDTRTRTPLYVLERLDVTEVLGRTPSRRPKFHEEKRLIEDHRSRLHHYRHSGFDRGHMAPAADFGLETAEHTFTLCNVCPQNHAMNVSIWAKLEHWCRSVAKEESKENGSETFVVTGPLWLPTNQMAEKHFRFGHLALGRPPSLVHVPTHFFKVIAVIKDSKLIKFACFVVPNEDPDPSRSTLGDYLVHWDDLEAVTGLEFFAGFVDRERGEIRSLRLSTDNILEASSTRLLQITDGTRRKNAGRSWRSTRQELVPHLCENGRCQ